MTPFRLIALFSFIGLVIWLSFPGSHPYRSYANYRIQIVFDGQPVTLTGRRECRREIDWFYGTSYECDPNWFVRILDDGSALVIGSAIRPGELAHKIEIIEEDGCPHQPTVTWINDAKDPAFGEYTYSAAALDDARSRVSLIQCDITSVVVRSKLIEALTSIPDGVMMMLGITSPAILSHGYDDPTVQLPWLNPDMYRSEGGWAPGLHAFFLIPKGREVWSQSGYLDAIGSNLNEATLIDRHFSIGASDPAGYSNTGITHGPVLETRMLPLTLEKPYLYRGAADAIANVDALIPLRYSDDEGFSTSPDPVPGVIYLHRSEGRLCQETLGLHIRDDLVFEVPCIPDLWFIYDPEGGDQMYYLGSLRISVLTPPVPGEGSPE